MPKYRQREIIRFQAHISAHTTLRNFPWKLGAACYHGGSVLVQFGRCAALHPSPLESLARALFERGV